MNKKEMDELLKGLSDHESEVSEDKKANAADHCRMILNMVNQHFEMYGAPSLGALLSAIVLVGSMALCRHHEQTKGD